MSVLNGIRQKLWAFGSAQCPESRRHPNINPPPNNSPVTLIWTSQWVISFWEEHRAVSCMSLLKVSGGCSCGTFHVFAKHCHLPFNSLRNIYPKTIFDQSRWGPEAWQGSHIERPSDPAATHLICTLGASEVDLSFSGDRVWNRKPLLFLGARGFASEMEASFCRTEWGWLSSDPLLTWRENSHIDLWRCLLVSPQNAKYV